MGLHEYKIKSGRRNAVETTVLLSDEDAKIQGLTAKDRVSSKDQSQDASNPEFKPVTEADLDPNAAEAAREAAEAAKREAERVNAEQAERVRVAEEAAAEAEARAKASEKQADKPANKSAAPAKNKSVATPTTK